MQPWRRGAGGKPELNGKSGMLKGLGLGLLLGAGLGSVAWAQGATNFDGQYIGELTLTGVINGDCTEPPLGALYPLTVSRGEVRFAYRPRFSTVLTGRIDKTGAFQASARAGKGLVRMTGRIDGARVAAEIVSPSCRYAFNTKD